MTGLRERKRRETREALVRAAITLFDRDGYEAATVAQIAAAAGVSTKTFFNYFPGKEDVLFLNPQRRLGAALRVIAAREQATPAAVLAAAVEEMIRYADEDDLATGMAAARLRLIMTVPAVQAAALQRVAVAARQLAAALRDAYPGRLDDDTAAAAVGALLGAVLAATSASVQRGDSPAQVAAAVRHATAIAASGLQSLGA